MNCNECDKFYIGQTTRSFLTRFKEHRADICNAKKDSSVSAITLHAREFGHSFSFTRFLDRDSYFKNLVRKESLYILSNNYNKNLVNFKAADCENVNEIWRVLLPNFRV